MSANSILEVVAELRQQDPAIQWAAAGESIETGRPTEFERMMWNGKYRCVPSEALTTSRMDTRQYIESNGRAQFIPYRDLRPAPEKGRCFMYRGQVQRHKPCLASLFRPLPKDELHAKALIMLERFRVAELELILRNHPFTAIAETHGLDVDYHGLAQHYGIDTSLLDLTTDLSVAAFFAVARWDKDEEKHVPMSAGRGVLYRFDWTADSLWPEIVKHINPVGLGPGLRPARQKAWTFRPGVVVDFENVRHVTTIEFDHSLTASQEVFAWFDQGRRLMPPDCLASLVAKVRALPFVTLGAMRHAARQDDQHEEQIEAMVERAADFLHTTLGVEFVDGYRLELETEDIEIAELQASKLDSDLRQISKGWRLVCGDGDATEIGAARITQEQFDAVIDLYKRRYGRDPFSSS